MMVAKFENLKDRNFNADSCLKCQNGDVSAGVMMSNRNFTTLDTTNTVRFVSGSDNFLDNESSDSANLLRKAVSSEVKFIDLERKNL